MAPAVRRCLAGLSMGMVMGSYEPKIEASTFDPALVAVSEIGDTAETMRLVMTYGGDPVSPWHDVPFSPGATADGTPLLSFVCEIPVGTRAKMEIHKSYENNPIVQDRHKDGTLRAYAYGESIVNYGAIAQTWEDPRAKDPDTALGGDNDPVDVLQLNARPCPRGTVQRVRVLGALALVDDGETDWKLLVVDADDEATPPWRDVDDVPTSRVDEVRQWFRLYKTAEGKGENSYAFDGRAVDAAHALGVARLTHAHWRAFIDDLSPCDFKGVACWAPRDAAATSRSPDEL